ncbi:MAG: molecular chaperone SurA [Burkholderiaceae bacterium]|nr:molecular chaperone SurA [Burkholderiaceae bacterium]
MNGQDTMHTSNFFRTRARLAALLLGVAIGAGVMPLAGAQPAKQKKNAPVLVDAIVAVVNSEVITRGELQDRMSSVEKNLRKQGTALPPKNVLRRQVLERLVVERIQQQQAKEAGIRIDDPTLDRLIARIAADNKVTLPQMRAKIEQDGVPFSQFREQVRQDVITQRLREKEVDNKVQVADSEVENYLNAVGAAQGQQEVNLGHILVRIPENASPEQIAQRQKRAEDIMQQLRAGKNFAQLAISYSDSDEALKGGELGWRSIERLPQVFADAIAKLSTGEVSGIVRSANGFHILKLVGKRSVGGASVSEPAIAPVQQTHARHILIKVNQLVTADEAKRKLHEIKQRIENKAGKFDELARSFSNDLSASRGGDLGWIYPGDTVPEFERAMNALKPGQLSEPIESPFGFHLIEVLERKVDDASHERKKMAVRQAIRERKIEEAMQDWLRQLRDGAYVEYRLEESGK